MCDNLDVKGKRCAMEWPELKYSSGVTWDSTCQLDSNMNDLPTEMEALYTHI
jgi:hypothetical protein